MGTTLKVIIWIGTSNILPTIGTIIAALIGWRNHVQGQEIHVLVNSNLTKVRLELENAQKMIAALVDSKQPPPPVPTV